MSPYRHIHPLLGLRPWRRHSLVLAVAAVVYVAYGVTLWRVDPTGARLQGIELATRLAPLDVWAGLWICSGVLAFASTRWPPTSETWGYTAMSTTATLWAAVYGLSMIFFDAPSSGIAGMLVWSMVAFMWWGISGLRNPDDLPRVDADEGR